MIETLQKVHHTSDSIQNISRLFKPESLIQELTPDLSETATESKLIRSIISKFKYRCAVAPFFLAYANEHLSLQEKRGLVYWVGIVDGADDLTDDLNFPEFSNEQDYKNFLLESTLPFADFKISDLNKILISSFPHAGKQELIRDTLDKMISAQMHHRGIPGTYGFQEAYDYRIKTTELYVRVGAELADVKSHEKIEQAVLSANMWQLVDDAYDLIDDARAGIKNQYIGIATDTSAEEVDYLKYIANSQQTKTPRNARTLIRAMPQTRAVYKNVFNQNLEYVPNGINKVFLKSVRRALL